MTTTSWVPVSADSPFPVQNLPYGVFRRAGSGEHPRVGVAIGDHVLDVARAAPRAPDLPGGTAEALAAPSLNPFMALGRPSWEATRAWLTEVLTDERHRPEVEPALVPRSEVELQLPVEIGDYVDFYASQHHAENVGRILRPGADPLPASWKSLPMGYHGRSGTVVVSGAGVPRPQGQRKAPGDDQVSFGPSLRLDLEAEVGFVVGAPSPRGRSIAVADFADHVFGVCLVNDWSARDIQAWEYVPLGPMLGKSFCTSLSPWVVPLPALEAARVAPPPRDPEPAAYLRDAEPWGLDLALEVEWNGTTVSHPPFATMYWTAAQQLAHLTVNGSSTRTGDLFASGTVSGPQPHQRGSLLELTWNGQEPLDLGHGQARTFLEDGDTVVLRATAPGLDGTTIGFGDVAGTILPAGSVP